MLSNSITTSRGAVAGIFEGGVELTSAETHKLVNRETDLPPMNGRLVDVLRLKNVTGTFAESIESGLSLLASLSKGCKYSTRALGFGRGEPDCPGSPSESQEPELQRTTS